jgi:hypothetical protein
MAGSRQPSEVFAVAGAEADYADWRADVEVDARVAADEVRYLEEPRTRIRVTGTPEPRRHEFTKRENLPAPVEPGQTYRNVRVRRRVGGRLAND